MPPKFMRDIQRTLLLNSSVGPLLYSYGTITLCGCAFQTQFRFSRWDPRGSTPHLPCVPTWDSVCPIPLSIAFNKGISFDFFSYGY